MDKKYKIGNISFRTQEEKQAAVKELYYINVLKEKYVFTDPESARKIIAMMEPSGVIQTKLGRRFMERLYDVIGEEPPVNASWRNSNVRNEVLFEGEKDTSDKIEETAQSEIETQSTAKLTEAEVVEQIETVNEIASEVEENNNDDEIVANKTETESEAEATEAETKAETEVEAEDEVEATEAEEITTDLVEESGNEIEFLDLNEIADEESQDTLSLEEIDKGVESEETRDDGVSLESLEEKEAEKAGSDEVVLQELERIALEAKDSQAQVLEEAEQTASQVSESQNDDLTANAFSNPKESQHSGEDGISNLEKELLTGNDHSPLNWYLIVLMVSVIIVLLVCIFSIMKKLPYSCILFAVAAWIVMREIMAIVKKRKIEHLIDAVMIKYHRNDVDFGEKYVEGAKGLSLMDLYASNLQHEELLERMEAQNLDLQNVYDCFEWSVQDGDVEQYKAIMEEKARAAFSGNVDQLPETQYLDLHNVHIKGTEKEIGQALEINVSYRMMPDKEKFQKLNQILSFFGINSSELMDKGVTDMVCNELFDAQKIENEWYNEGDLFRKYKKVLNPYSFRIPTIPAILATEYYIDCRNIKNKLEFVHENIRKYAEDICKTVADKIFAYEQYKAEELTNRLIGEMVVAESRYLEELGGEQRRNVDEYYEEVKKLVSHPYEFKIGTIQAFQAIVLHTYYVAKDTRLVDFVKMRKIISFMITVALVIGGILLL